MQRAQREADGPKRRIIEAAKAREKAAARAEAAAPRAKAAVAAASAASAAQPLVATAPSTAAQPSPSPAAVVQAVDPAATPPSRSASLPAAAAVSPPPESVRAAPAPDGRSNPALGSAPVQAAQPPAPVPMPSPPPTPIPAQRLAAEDAYAQDLNRLVDGLKRYPTSREARALRPQGTVQLWLELDRSGQLLQAGLADTSGAPLLDGEALRSVRQGRYAPFPAGAFDGQPSRRFRVAIEYRYDGG
jgi:protein TonB